MTKAEVFLENGHVICSIDGITEFRDTVKHWEDAVVRLLDRDEDEMFRFIGNACSQLVEHNARGAEVIQILKNSWLNAPSSSAKFAKPKPPSWITTVSHDATWLTDSVRDSAEFGIALSSLSHHAWLAHRESGLPAGLESVTYESDYFEGGKTGVGYGSYATQAEWRLEKAARQCREVAGIMKFFGLDTTDTRILDVGSGYGYFRRACADIGWSTQGVEISKFACRIASEMFDLDTFSGTLESFSATCVDGFDVIVMWDFIEHVEDPNAALAAARNLLKDGGLLFIRTPNLDAIELEVFGSSYHSLKREHLNLFSALSLSRFMYNSGLNPVLTHSESHLLSGFMRSEVCSWATTLKGSDLISVGRRSRE